MNKNPKNAGHIFKRFLFGLGCLFLVMVLFYAEEDWRGWHAWNHFKHQWEAKGERFDPASVIPPTVPDDQNFALTPIVASCYLGVLDQNGRQLRPADTNVVNRLKMAVAPNGKSPPNGIGNRQKSTMTDLRVWQQYYRAQAETADAFPVARQPQSPAADVLLALSKYDSAIKELRQASKLPASRFPLEYNKEDPWAILLPHLAALKGCAQVLQLRAIAELQNGQSEQALDDVKLMLRLTDSVRTEPFLISHLVRIAILQIVLQPVWEGLARHQWSETQLIELDRELARLDFLSDYKLPMRGELVFQGSMFDFLRRHPEQFPNLPADGNFIKTPLPARIIWRLIPSGWLYQNQLRCARPMVERYLPLSDVNRGIISPTAARQADAVIEADTKHRNPYNVAEKLFLPALGAAARKFANGQSSADMARVALALERYRLAHGAYPESLDMLTPQFIAKLPHDVINSQPLHYRPEPGGQFVLYSVGWNETDDDGEVGLTKNGNVDISTGDWVWQYPAR